MTKSTCSICDELMASSHSRFSSVINSGGIKNAIFHETCNYAVIPSIGPLTNGHCLVVPKRHVNNVMISGLSSNILHEVEECIDLIASHFGVGKSLIIGEHGSKKCQSNVNLCSTEHAHLHVIPVPDDKASPIVNTFHGEQVSKDMKGLAEYLTGHDEYVFLSNYTGWKINFASSIVKNDRITSQMARRHIGFHIGNNEWNWKKYARTNELRSMVSQDFQLNRIIRVTS